MAKGDQKRVLRRKQDNFYTQPVTAAEAAEIAGFNEGEYEWVEPVEPIVVKDDDAPAPRARTSQTRTAKPRTRKPAATGTAAAPADGAGDAGDAAATSKG